MSSRQEPNAATCQQGRDKMELPPPHTTVAALAHSAPSLCLGPHRRQSLLYGGPIAIWASPIAGLHGIDRVNALNATRQTLLAGAGGIVVIAGAIFTGCLRSRTNWSLGGR